MTIKDYLTKKKATEEEQHQFLWYIRLVEENELDEYVLDGLWKEYEEIQTGDKASAEAWLKGKVGS